MRERRRKPNTLLFAYGAAMNPNQTAALRCDPALVAVARLPNHAVAFFGHSEVWDGGFETLVEREGAETWGVIYALAPSELDRFDVWRGVRLDGGGAYFHMPTEVFGQDGARHEVLFHRKAVMGPLRLPSIGCRDYLADGAATRGLPEAYVAALRAMDAVPARYPVPKNDRTVMVPMSDLASCC